MYQILIVDDKEIFRRKMKRLPCFKNNDVFTIQYEAQNGLEALEIIKKEKVDVVITDIRMPIIDGLELLKEIKDEQLCKCVILLSEYSDFEYAKKGLVYGAFDYIVKPVDDGKVSAVLERAQNFLEAEYSNQFYSFREIELIEEHLLKNEAYAVEIAEKIFLRIEEKCKNQLQAEIQISMALQSICTEIAKNRNCLKKLVDFDEICKLRVSDRMAEDALDAVKRMIKEIKKFYIEAKSELVNNVGYYVLEHVDEEVSLKIIAEKYFVNKDYISHVFKAETGQSFTDYMTMVKMEYAKKILSNSDMKIYEVALKVGYKDTEYFSRVFKKYFGHSPSGLRRENDI